MVRGIPAAERGDASTSSDASEFDYQNPIHISRSSSPTTVFVDEDIANIQDDKGYVEDK